ncbi:MAG: thioredoxin family protein [Verrucomicrobiota bacterium]
MRKFILILFACCMAAPVFAADSAWLVSVPQAMAQARQENKLVLLDFTGSDWCGWCKKLAAETFAQPGFIEYAGKNLVLVEIDFPHQTPQSAELRKINQALQKQYDVKGYPTLVALKPDGSVVWKQTGFLRGGPDAIIAELDKVKPKTAVPASPAPAVVVPVQWPAPPPRQPGDEPKLQGIFYSASHASIILEGKSCSEGDSVDGMRVLKITRDKVTVEWKGQAKVLKMN